MELDLCSGCERRKKPTAIFRDGWKSELATVRWSRGERNVHSPLGRVFFFFEPALVKPHCDLKKKRTKFCIVRSGVLCFAIMSRPLLSFPVEVDSGGSKHYAAVHAQGQPQGVSSPDALAHGSLVVLAGRHRPRSESLFLHGAINVYNTPIPSHALRLSRSQS